MTRYIVTLLITLLALRGKAHAFCQPPGDERACFVNGEEGTQVCLDSGQFSPCSVATPPPPPPGFVAFVDHPNGLVASTGNLYWTSNSPPGTTGTPGVSAVWRSGKNSVPGDEILLYSEQHSPGALVTFGDIVLANAGGFFGYFIAAGGNPVMYLIKRVPLSGGAAEVLATLSTSVLDGHGLMTDGTSLFWADTSGIRKMPLGGGTIATLVVSNNISLAVYDGNGNVIFVEGQGGLRKVSTLGGTVTTLFGASTSRITALYATPTQVYWGDNFGAVRSSPNAASGAQGVYQPPTTTRATTSVGFDGTRVLWVDCEGAANTGCVVRKLALGTVNSVVIDDTGANEISHLQWDAASVYWHDLTSVRKFVH